MNVRGPIVSVIIPTYKRPFLVTRAIASVLKQSYQDFEIIVIDDASNDDTAAAVKGIVDSRIRYVCHEHNKGQPAVRNTGIAEARGYYIAFLDDDDQWHPEKLARQLAAIRNYDAILCGSRTTSNRNNLAYRGSIVDADVLKRGNIFVPSGLLAKSSIFRDLKFDVDLPRGVGEDWDMFIRMARTYRIGYLNEPLLVYDDSETTPRITNEHANMSIQELERRMAMLKKHRGFFGPYWFNYHTASMLLTYIGKRNNKWEHISYAISECGVVPVCAVLVDKFRRRMRRGRQLCAG